MADPDKPGSKTTEFILTLLVNVVGAIAASGLIVSNQWVQIFGLASIVLSTALYTWQRTVLKTANAQEATAQKSIASDRKPEGGFADVFMMSGFLFVGVTLAIVVACGSITSGPKNAGRALVDCTKKQTATTVHELRPFGDALLSNALSGGSVDWGPVRDVAKGFATDVGRCVLADAVTRALAPKPVDPTAPKVSPLDVDPTAMRDGFRKLAGDLYDGAEFKTEHGAL
jgi:hypothetical protein